MFDEIDEASSMIATASVEQAAAVDNTPASSALDSTFHHLGTAALYTIVSVLLFGMLYPLVLTGIAQIAFPGQAMVHS